MSEQGGMSGQSGILRLDIADNAELYAAYMPFILNGGLFVSQKFLGRIRYDLGSSVFLLLYLSAQDERIPVSGEVVWSSPAGATRPQGIGIQFASTDRGATQEKIETILAGQLDSPRSTHTF